MHSVDLSYLRRHDMLTPGKTASLSWSKCGHETGSIRIIAEPEGVRLVYRTTGKDGAPLDVRELVPYLYTPTRFGGRRCWLQCLSCKRGCRVLYGGHSFRCRRCYGLGYRSQQEPYYQRAVHQADKIRRRLVDQWGCAFDGDEFPPKPKRMRWATYWRLKERYTDLQDQWAGGVISKFFLQ